MCRRLIGLLLWYIPNILAYWFSSRKNGYRFMNMNIASFVSEQKTMLVTSFVGYINHGKQMGLLSSEPKPNSIYLIEENVVFSEEIRRRCKYDIFIPLDKEQWPSVKSQLDILLQKTQAGKTPTLQDTLLDAGDWSHFVSLTYPSIDAAKPFLPEIRLGADAWELRVDLLDDITPSSLHRQIALLRHISPLPIVFTVRSIGQIGKFPSEPDKMFALLREGVRAGAEWIDIEACWPKQYIDELTRLILNGYSTTSRILGSLHVTVPQTEEQVTALFAACDLGGAAHVVKVVTGAANDDDCRLVHTCGSQAGKPYIGLALGAAGSLSRVLNRRFTPVTHALMAVAAPGQLTAAQLMQQRATLDMITPKKFYLFGTPIKQSMSPAMHNSAYKALLLPHIYSLAESDTVDSYETLLQDPAFGGASVTIPHKETIGRFLDEISPEAKTIGAVNTVARFDNKLVGYNTDWLGMRIPISRYLAPDSKGKEGLVIGAGGTAKAACFALRSLGLDILVYNRSPEKGMELATQFGGKFVSDLSIYSAEDIAVVISTVPAAAAFTLPKNIIDLKPIVLDVVYKPVRTPLIDQALAGGCSTIQGATMLLEQGIQQFEIWNRRRAPRTEMDRAVFGGIERI